MAFEELKQRQSVMWGNGPYQRITETIVDIHDIVLERLAPQDGTAGSTSPAEPVRSPSGPQRPEPTSPGSTSRPC